MAVAVIGEVRHFSAVCLTLPCLSAARRMLRLYRHLSLSTCIEARSNSSRQSEDEHDEGGATPVPIRRTKASGLLVSFLEMVRELGGTASRRTRSSAKKVRAVPVDRAAFTL